MRANVRPLTTLPPEDYEGGYEYNCGRDCAPKFFNRRAHLNIQAGGAKCVICECELVLVWGAEEPDSASSGETQNFEEGKHG